jgi:hypothetical protein
MREEPIYQTWYDKIYPSTIKEMPIREITKELPKISHQDMKDIVSSLIQLYGWKQKDASKVVNNYVKLHKNIDNLEDLLKGILKDENKKKKG